MGFECDSSIDGGEDIYFPRYPKNIFVVAECLPLGVAGKQHEKPPVRFQRLREAIRGMWQGLSEEAPLSDIEFLLLMEGKRPEEKKTIPDAPVLDQCFDATLHLFGGDPSVRKQKIDALHNRARTRVAKGQAHEHIVACETVRSPELVDALRLLQGKKLPHVTMGELRSQTREWIDMLLKRDEPRRRKA